jgi:hypothetical protein
MAVGGQRADGRRTHSPTLNQERQSKVRTLILPGALAQHHQFHLGALRPEQMACQVLELKCTHYCFIHLWMFNQVTPSGCLDFFLKKNAECKKNTE